MTRAWLAGLALVLAAASSACSACSVSVSTTTKGQVGGRPMTATPAALKALEAYETQLATYCSDGQLTAPECKAIWDRVLALVDAAPEARAGRLAALDAQTNALDNREARDELRRRLAAIRKQL